MIELPENAAEWFNIPQKQLKCAQPWEEYTFTNLPAAHFRCLKGTIGTGPRNEWFIIRIISRERKNRITISLPGETQNGLDLSFELNGELDWAKEIAERIIRHHPRWSHLVESE